MAQNAKPSFTTMGGGFTLIELLVVISIIGLLSSVVLASLSGARKKARDAQALTEIKEIQTALELYYNEYGYYPLPSENNYDADNKWCFDQIDSAGNTGCLYPSDGKFMEFLNGKVTVGSKVYNPQDIAFLAKTPLPPANHVFYYYSFNSYGGCSTESYMLMIAGMEARSAPSGDHCFSSDPSVNPYIPVNDPTVYVISGGGPNAPSY